MLTKMLEMIETLESNNTKNIATKVALVSMQKLQIDILKRNKLVM